MYGCSNSLPQCFACFSILPEKAVKSAGKDTVWRLLPHGRFRCIATKMNKKDKQNKTKEKDSFLKKKKKKKKAHVVNVIFLYYLLQIKRKRERERSIWGENNKKIF